METVTTVGDLDTQPEIVEIKELGKEENQNIGEVRIIDRII